MLTARYSAFRRPMEGIKTWRPLGLYLTSWDESANTISHDLSKMHDAPADTPYGSPGEAAELRRIVTRAPG